MKAFLAASERGGRKKKPRDDCVSRSETEALHYSASLALAVTVTKHMAPQAAAQRDATAESKDWQDAADAVTTTSRQV